VCDGVIRTLIVALLLGACAREQREAEPVAAGAARPAVPILSAISPGQSLEPSAALNPYQGNALGLSDGKRLFNWYNCVGCHAHGGGGMGPPLMDERWIYGSSPENIYSTILEGRPNGMPSFRAKIPDFQVWQLVAYVRSLSGLAPKDAAPGRDDAMSVRRPENITTTRHPIAEPAVHPP
jgi:cytochrome c oxidase cbb3-type subunit 3